MEISFYHHKDFLEVSVAGKYSLKEANDILSMMILHCQTAGLSKTLVDFREMAGAPLASEQIKYAFSLHNHHKKLLKNSEKPLCIAYVGPSRALNTYQLGIEYVESHDLPFKLFTAIDDAKEWLALS